MKDVIPRKVAKAIAKHLRQKGRDVHLGWEVNQADEDALTGGAFQAFHTPNWRLTELDGITWKWRVIPKKFIGRSMQAEETHLGADGIVELEVQSGEDAHIYRKGLLIQSKKRWSGTNSLLLSQVKKMEALAPGGSAVLDFWPTQYSMMDGQDVIEVNGNRRLMALENQLTIGDFLADRFIPCHVGQKGLYFEANRHTLILPRSIGNPVAIEIPIGHRLRIEVEEEGA